MCETGSPSRARVPRSRPTSPDSNDVGLRHPTRLSSCGQASRAVLSCPGLSRRNVHAAALQSPISALCSQRPRFSCFRAKSALSRARRSSTYWPRGSTGAAPWGPASRTPRRQSDQPIRDPPPPGCSPCQRITNCGAASCAASCTLQSPCTFAPFQFVAPSLPLTALGASPAAGSRMQSGRLLQMMTRRISTCGRAFDFDASGPPCRWRSTAAALG
jgi:hypothetical protein